MIETIHHVPRDPRGWFYRAVAPSPDCAVLEVGDGFAENWFPNVVRSGLRQRSTAGSGLAEFDLIVLHYTLGGCKTLGSAIELASRLLRKDALLVIAGENRIHRSLRRTHTEGSSGPRATGWAFRSLMTRGGLKNVALFITHPAGSAPMYVVHTSRRSAREFFRTSLKARQLPSWSPVRLAQIALIELNLMTYLQPSFLVVGQKC